MWLCVGGTGEPRFWGKGVQALVEVLCRCMGSSFVTKHLKGFPHKPKNDTLVPTKVCAVQGVPSRLGLWTEV